MSGAAVEQTPHAREGTVRPARLMVVIVCYRAADLTIDCLASLEPEIAANEGVGVVVCENGTGPESAQQIRDAIEQHAWGGWCELWERSPNRGFSGGNNMVLDEIVTWEDAPEHVLLLNADTIVHEGAIRAMLDAIDEHPEVGVVSPRLEWPDGTPQVSCFRDFRPLSEFEKACGLGIVSKILSGYVTAVPVSDNPSSPDWTSFACALIRTSLLREIGTLDPGYFLYFDDPDYCLMARNAGHGVLNVPDARVVHLRGRSNPAKELAQKKKRRPWYHFASRARYYAKHHGRAGLLMANVFWTLGYLVALLRRLFTGRRTPACEREWRDIWTNFASPMRPPEKGQDG